MTKSISSDRGCQSAKPAADGRRGGRVDYTISGATGLRLRVSRDRAGNVSKKWSLVYTPKDSPKKARIVLGSYPTMPLVSAKAAATEYRGKIAAGADPAADARTSKVAETFEELANLWIERHAKVKKRTWRNDQYMLKADLVPALGGLKAAKVTAANISRIVDGIMDRGAPYQANRVLILAKTIFRWGEKRGIVDANPARDLDKPSDERKRKRVLKPEEIRRFWHGLADAPMTPALQIALKLALITGQRINELGLARRSEFDLESHMWIMPGRRDMPGARKTSGTKNKDDHHLPLTALAEELLNRAFELADGGEWLFPGARGPVGEQAISRAYRRAREGLGLPDTRPHDLRRTWATIAGDLGFNDFDVGLCLNHRTSRGGVTGDYNQARYMREKRQVLEAVERHLLAIIEDREPAANVVALRA